MLFAESRAWLWYFYRFPFVSFHINSDDMWYTKCIIYCFISSSYTEGTTFFALFVHCTRFSLNWTWGGWHIYLRIFFLSISDFRRIVNGIHYQWIMNNTSTWRTKARERGRETRDEKRQTFFFRWSNETRGNDMHIYKSLFNSSTALILNMHTKCMCDGVL